MPIRRIKDWTIWEVHGLRPSNVKFYSQVNSLPRDYSEGDIMADTNKNRRLSIESLEDRRLLAGSIDLNVDVHEVDRTSGDETSQAIPAPYRNFKFNIHWDSPSVLRKSPEVIILDEP
jgi:hypothetical protein